MPSAATSRPSTAGSAGPLRADGLHAGRLSAAELAENFADVHPPLDGHEARVAADRCYFCYDAPCITACPTSIDIPLFIRQIATGLPDAAARTIFDQNILGGLCARVCPTEQLCEQACVREAAEGQPVQIGALQRFATDSLMAKAHPYQRAADSGRTVAVVGAGPAGLACAHRLAMHGHRVTLYDRRAKPGGLNEYGIASYKTVDDFAQREVAWLLSIGGITLRNGEQLGDGLSLEGLRRDYDALFLAVGKGGVRELALPGQTLTGVEPAVQFIERLRQSPDRARLPVGRRVVVIGGGMTAIDAANQARALGAEEVTLVYRGPRERMSASPKEQRHAQRRGVRLLCDASPVALLGDGQLSAVRFRYRDAPPDDPGFTLPADQLLLAIGQTLAEGDLGAAAGLQIADGVITVDAEGRTTLNGVWAGGDCASGGDDLSVTAVAQGRDAAESIHRHLSASS